MCVPDIQRVLWANPSVRITTLHRLETNGQLRHCHEIASASSKGTFIIKGQGTPQV